jgi:hypothetical protein
MKVSLCLEFKAPVYVKVKAYKRVYNGRIVKVHSYYRRVVER